MISKLKYNYVLVATWGAATRTDPQDPYQTGRSLYPEQKLEMIGALALITLKKTKLQCVNSLPGNKVTFPFHTERSGVQVVS